MGNGLQVTFSILSQALTTPVFLTVIRARRR